MSFDKNMIASGVEQILLGLGENPSREGLHDTPTRVAKAFIEMCGGYEQDPREVLSRDFDGDGYDEMIVLREVDFSSLCEHHLLNFSGTATVAYVPGQRVVGLSKLARLVDCFARRLQIQERMTKQIADALESVLAPKGWGVSLRARHLCMVARGVKKPQGEMVTTVVGGLIKEDPKARAEFIRAAGL